MGSCKAARPSEYLRACHPSRVTQVPRLLPESTGCPCGVANGKTLMSPSPAAIIGDPSHPPGARCSGPVSRARVPPHRRPGAGRAGLSQVPAARAAARTSSDTSVILVYLLGGPSHLETYDLKPDGPEQMRSVFRPIATRVPGMSICELLPLQAQRRRQVQPHPLAAPQDQHPQRRLHRRADRQGADRARSDLDGHAASIPTSA